MGVRSSRRSVPSYGGSTHVNLDTALSYMVSTRIIVSINPTTSRTRAISKFRTTTMIKVSWKISDNSLQSTLITLTRGRNVQVSGVMYPIVASMEIRPCLSSVWRRRLKFSTLPSAVKPAVFAMVQTMSCFIAQQHTTFMRHACTVIARLLDPRTRLVLALQVRSQMPS